MLYKLANKSCLRLASGVCEKFHVSLSLTHTYTPPRTPDKTISQHPKTAVGATRSVASRLLRLLSTFLTLRRHKCFRCARLDLAVAVVMAKQQLNSLFLCLDRAKSLYYIGGLTGGTDRARLSSNNKQRQLPRSNFPVNPTVGRARF